MQNQSGDTQLDDPTDGPKSHLPVSVEGVKRQTTAAACQRCRGRKQKCSGQRPCESCRRSGTECVFFGKENETRQQAAKRKFDEYHEVYDQILHGSESQALEIVHRIRSGEQLDSILRFPRRVNIQETLPITYEKRQKQAFLVKLCQCTGSLREVVDLASSVFHPYAKTSLPDTQDFKMLKDSLITIEMLYSIVNDPTLNNQQASSSYIRTAHTLIPDGAYNGPTFWVPALPWTTLVESNYAVSHMISIFLVYINPYWRLVEEDLFLKAMRGGNRDTGYCSTFLVHAILACAAQFTEIDEAFIRTGDFITRGENFHTEAVRLSNQESQPTIASVQALLILSLESSMRGKDRSGLRLVTSALILNKSIPYDNALLLSEQARANYTRCRQCVATSTSWLFLSYHFGLTKGGDAFRDVVPEDIPDLNDVLPDTTLYWMGYPITKKPIPLRMNLMMRQRRTMIHLLWDTCKIISNSKSSNRDELWNNALDVTAELYIWHKNLPAGLCYDSKMAANLFEFHGQYNCIIMTLYMQILGGYDTITPERDLSVRVNGEMFDEGRQKYEQARQQVLAYAYQAVNNIHDFRLAYGYKITLPYIVQQAAIAAMIFLRNLQSGPAPGQNGTYRDRPLQDLEAGLEECFRCLIGSGTQLMLPRGIARMLFHTSKLLKVQLPTAVQQMLAVVADAAWRPSDVDNLDSIYPNIAIGRDWKHGDPECHMEDMLRKWEKLGVQDGELEK